MELNDTTIKKLIILFLIILFAALTFLLIKPIIFSIIGGLLLAYIFHPFYKFTLKYVKEKNTAASIVSFIVILALIGLTVLLVPIVARQAFELYKYSQNIDLSGVASSIFPEGSDEFINQLSTTLTNLVGKLSSGTLNSLVNIILNFPILLLHAFVIAFVFFFSLRDEEKLRKFASEISPLSKEQNSLLVHKFRRITDSIIYGQIIVGFVQGIVAGIGFILFGVPNAFFLTFLAVILGIIPIIGPGLIWVPITVYLLLTANLFVGILYLVYNLLITSTIDNILRTYIVAKRTEQSSVTVLIGMIGGIFVFGIMGLIIGPLIIVYFLTILKAYREKTLSSLFKE